MRLTNFLSRILKFLLVAGPKQFVAISKNYLSIDSPSVVDEARIAFEVFEACGYAGTMVDVGAHYGSSLSLFADIGWKVFAFEPDSKNRVKLEENFSGRANVYIDNRALSDISDEKADFYRSKESTGISGLSAFHESHEVGQTVSVTTLAAFLKEQQLEQLEIDFLKVDVEGYDLKVLQGVPWETIEPRMILCEFENFKTKPLGYDFHDLANYLTDKEYSLVVSEWYPIERYGVQHRWRRFSRYPCELVDENAWGNIIATKDATLLSSLISICKI